MGTKKEDELPELPSLDAMQNNLDQLMADSLSTSDMPKMFSGDDPEGFFMKIMLYGPAGTGKSMALVKLLLAGERLFIASSDPGGNGLVTVQNELRRIGRLDLAKNYLRVDVPTYKTALALWTDPYRWYGEHLNKLNPTIVVWEGFSYAQIQGIDEEVMPDSLRAEKADGIDPFVFWDKVRRATLRVHDKFLQCHGRGPNGERTLWHHILTCHQGDPREDKKGGGGIMTKALVQGQAAKMVSAAYDLIIQTFIKNAMIMDEGQSRYRYRCLGASDEFEVKNRGFDIPDEMDANFSVVWEKCQDVLKALEKGVEDGGSREGAVDTGSSS